MRVIKVEVNCGGKYCNLCKHRYPVKGIKCAAYQDNKGNDITLKRAKDGRWAERCQACLDAEEKE